MKLGRKEKTIYKRTRILLKSIIVFSGAMLGIQIVMWFVLTCCKLSTNNLIAIFLWLLLIPIWMAWIYNLTNVFLYYLWVGLFLFTDLFLFLIPVLDIFGIGLSDWKILLPLLLGFSFLIFYFVSSLFKKDVDFIELNSKDAKRNNFIDLESHIVRFDKSKTLKHSAMFPKLQIQIAMLFGAFLLVVFISDFSFYGKFNMLESFDIKIWKKLLYLGIPSVFLSILSIMFPFELLYQYLSIRRYEKEHNIKFRTNFILVEERFKEFNEKRKRDGLKPKSLTWAFIRGNLIELMEKEENQ